MIERQPQHFYFIIDGEPAPKKRPRFGTVYTKNGPVMKARTDEQTAAAEKWALSAFQSAYPGVEPMTGLLRVTLEFYSRATHHQMAGRTDGDNLAKLVLDALNKKAFKDDYQVVELHVYLTREIEDEEPCTVVTIEPIDVTVEPVAASESEAA